VIVGAGGNRWEFCLRFDLMLFFSLGTETGMSCTRHRASPSEERALSQAFRVVVVRVVCDYIALGVWGFVVVVVAGGRSAWLSSVVGSSHFLVFSFVFRFIAQRHCIYLILKFCV